MILINCYNKFRELYFKYEKIILPLSFLMGILWDNFTLRRIDLFYENFVFLWGLLQSIIIIALINAYDSGKLRWSFFEKIVPFLPVFLQFAFGNLFSGFIIFYVRSGSLFVSWPFLISLLVLFLGNEFFRKKYLNLTFQISIFFIALFSYSVFLMPILLKKMDVFAFLVGGLVSLFFISLIIIFLFFAAKEKLKLNLRPILFSVGGIYVLFQVFYFTNIIPPIPLSIKESGIYHSIEQIKDKKYLYRVSFEPPPSYLFFKEQSDTFHWIPGNAIYSYSAVFSPTNLNTKILHRWLYFDEKKGIWVEINKLSLGIIGGRDGGYRGYSYITNIRPGKWRVDVITERGQVLGRMSFRVIETNQSPYLKTDLR